VGPTRRWVVAGGVATALGCALGRPPAAQPVSPPPAGEPGQLFRVDARVPRPPVRWDEPPAWFRDAPALWCPSNRTAGSALLTFAPRGVSPEDLSERLRDFRELPRLLEQGRRLGTDVVYLTEWYQGAPGADPHAYWWNKAEYLPRADLGGEAALIEGLAAVRKAGGRVLLYVETFIIEKNSELGRSKGDAWSIRLPGGHPDDPYPSSWKLCPAAPGLQEHFVALTARLVGRYGAAGLHLDSYGNQRGWRCVHPDHPHPKGDNTVFDEGARQLVRAMRDEARRHDPEAVLMVEGSKMPGLFQWVDAAQDWGIHDLAARWSWREAGHAAIFTSGWSLDDLHQILALGQRVGLGGDYWATAPQGACAAAVTAARATLGRPPDERMRRYGAEVLYRLLHRWRNGALLAGVPVPALDDLTPRRWDGVERFATEAAWGVHLDRCAEAAAALDAAIGGAALPSAQEHVRQRLAARAALSRVLRGAEVEVLPPPSPHAAAYRFTGPAGVGVGCVNVADAPVRFAVAAPGLVDLVRGGPADAGALEVPGHDVGLWATA
jgi:hypothetical protein